MRGTKGFAAVVLAVAVVAGIAVVVAVQEAATTHHQAAATELQQLPALAAVRTTSSPPTPASASAPAASAPAAAAAAVPKGIVQHNKAGAPRLRIVPHMHPTAPLLSKSGGQAAAVVAASSSASSSSSSAAAAAAATKKKKTDGTTKGGDKKNKTLASDEHKKKLTEAQKKAWVLKLRLKGLLYRQRYEENQALGVRRAALQEWAEYKLDLDDAEHAARQSARYSHAILKYAKKAVHAKKKEQSWASSAFADLKKAEQERITHPEHITPEHKMSEHEKYLAASDSATNYELDPFHDRFKKPSPLKKAEDELEARVFSGDASKSEIKAYHELHRMHHWENKKRRNTYMGEVLEVVRKNTFGHRFNELMSEADSHARTARKYTRISSRIVKKAKAITRLERKVLSDLRKVEANPASMQKARRVVVQLVDAPPPKK